MLLPVVEPLPVEPLPVAPVPVEPIPVPVEPVLLRELLLDFPVLLLPDVVPLREALEGSVTLAPFWLVAEPVLPVRPVLLPVDLVPVSPVLLPVEPVPVNPVPLPVEPVELVPVVPVPVVLLPELPLRLLPVLEPERLDGVVTLAPLLEEPLLLPVAAKAGRVNAALRAVMVTRRRVNEFNANIEDS